MLKPENTDPQYTETVERDSDIMETTVPGQNVPETDSPSSEADAGLLDELRDFDSFIDSDFDEADAPREIPMTDAFAGSEPQLHSPEMSDMNAPGELDIEELDERAVEDALPPDARLDPLED